MMTLILSKSRTLSTLLVSLIIGYVFKYRRDWIQSLLKAVFGRATLKSSPRSNLSSVQTTAEGTTGYPFPYHPDESVEKEVLQLPIVERLTELLGPKRPFQNPKWLDFYRNHFIRGSLFNQDIISYAHSHYSTETKTLASLIKLQTRVCGHKDIVHGGLCAAIFDEILGEVFYCDAEGKYMGFTASLTINYRSPMPANRLFIWLVKIVKREGRKVYLKGQVRDAVHLVEGASVVKKGDGDLFSHLIDDRSVLYAEADALFIIPKTPLPVDSMRK